MDMVSMVMLLNPANRYNPAVPFAPLDGGTRAPIK